MSLVDERTYSGTYIFYESGNHSYDLLFSTGDHLVGRGNWSINEYNMGVRNDTGSTYQGVYSDGGFVLTTTDGRWQLTLTR